MHLMSVRQTQVWLELIIMHNCHRCLLDRWLLSLQHPLKGIEAKLSV